MPIVEVKMLSGRSLEQKRALVREVTDALVRTIETTPESVNVLIDEYALEDWAFESRLFIDRSDGARLAQGGDQ